MGSPWEKLLALARRRGAGYADIRLVKTKTESVALKNDAVDTLTARTDAGYGVRVLYHGAWGFASRPGADAEGLEEVVERAVGVARASARRQREPAELAPVPPAVDHYRSPVVHDPFDVKLEDRMELLREAVTAMGAEVSVARAGMSIFRTEKTFASSEGAYITQDLIESGASLSALCRDGREVQTRSFGDYATRGYEFIQELDLPHKARAVAWEARALLEASSCPAGVTDLICGGSMVALQVHESCGHPVELDRVLGSEATFAGTSFLTLEKRGNFQYGSEAVTLTADATIPGGFGSFGYDDEGVPAQRTTLVDCGKFANYLTSRETAGRFGQESNGTMRAVGWQNLPLIRMTNINLEPGDWTPEEIIADTKRGIFVEGPKSWSLDDKRLNFHFGQEVAYEVVDGSLGRMLKDPAYTGMTPEFWNACDAVAGPRYWRVHGLPGCAKGEPVQSIHVGHGAAPARFRQVKVGVGQ
ncbi:MAG TPA: peptidase C69 [Clostridiales bacterium UBA8153]|nr:peptidase C69 [Clostridiales bacterium UBA8153]